MKKVICAHGSGIILFAGWLLMAPPLVEDQLYFRGIRPATEAPIARWEQISAHDTAKECEAYRRVGLRELEQSDDKSSVVYSEKVKILSARCIPADHIYPPKKPGN